MATAKSRLEIIIDVVTGNTKRDISQIDRDITNLVKTFATVTAGIVAFGVAAKKAFDIGKEGAGILLTQQRFDRLAESIGTTGDALIRDLVPAMGGMMSEAETMAAATDLMALGLVKSHDEALRLSTVAGQLGMNMNQLVLTLTNQTTMRFDALGVSVDGFKEKVKALEATGMSAQDAFGEAFLQQAEEQLERVGSAADTTAGSFARLEARTKDLSDEFKVFVALGLEPAVVAATDMLTAENALRDAVASGLITQEEATRMSRERSAMLMSNADIIKYLTFLEDEHIARLDKVAPGVQLLAAEYASYDKVLMNFNNTQEDATQGALDLEEANQGAAVAITNVSKAALGKTALEALTQAYNEGTISAAEFETGQRNILTQWLGMTDAEANAGIALANLEKDFAAGLIPVDQYYRSLLGIGSELHNLNGKTFRTTYILDVQGAVPSAISTGATGQSYSQRYQHGGSFMIPPGYNENFAMGAGSSGERVSVTPRQGNTYNQTWNMYTNGGQNLLERDYNMRRALAQ